MMSCCYRLEICVIVVCSELVCFCLFFVCFFGGGGLSTGFVTLQGGFSRKAPVFFQQNQE